MSEPTAKDRYFDPYVQAWCVKVRPGSWELSDSDILCATAASCAVLGVWDSAHNRAVMSHFMVEPTAPANWTADSLPSPHAEALLGDMWAGLQMPVGEGTQPAYKAAVAGGGTMMLCNHVVVGQANVMKAVDWVHKNKLELGTYDVGDTVIRRVYFSPATGEAKVLRVGLNRNDTVRRREEIYLQSFSTPHQQGQVA